MNLQEALAIVLADSIGETKRTENHDLYYRAREIVAGAARNAPALNVLPKELAYRQRPTDSWTSITPGDGVLNGEVLYNDGSIWRLSNGFRHYEIKSAMKQGA